MHLNYRAKGHIGRLHIGRAHRKLFDTCCYILALATSNEARYFLRIRIVYAKDDFCACITQDILVEVTDALASYNHRYAKLASLFHNLGKSYISCKAMSLIQYDNQAQMLRIAPAEHISIQLTQDECTCCQL